jgi:hypothetical protein
MPQVSDQRLTRFKFCIIETESDQTEKISSKLHMATIKISVFHSDCFDTVQKIIIHYRVFLRNLFN